MKILIAGATGLVGSALGLSLVKQGHQVVVASRNPSKTSRSCPFPHISTTSPPAAEAIEGVEAVVNLSGENVAGGRWTPAFKDRLKNSRIEGTRKLYTAFAEAGVQPQCWVNASAVGYYGNRDEELIDESASPGQDFLARLCVDWEKEALEPGEAFNGTRKVALRVGIVLTTEGGALEKMLPPFQLGVGGPLASGRQGMSWIHLTDLVRAIEHLLFHSGLEGPVNATAPQPENNRNFTNSLSRALKVWAPFPAPKAGLKLILGEFAAALTGGQFAIPKALMEDGFTFHFEHLDEALGDLLEHEATGGRTLVARQYIQRSPEELFPFFKDETNLERITPPLLGFKVLGKSTPEIDEGTLIDYQLKLHGVPMAWKTRIESWNPPHRFVDTQLKGPYQLWHHTHDFEELGDGTLMTDTVRYRLPLHWIGRLVERAWVHRDVAKIFEHRFTAVEEIFP